MALIEDTTFVVSTNGYADSPAQALRDYLLARKAESLTVVAHPLSAGAENRHVVTTYRRGVLVHERTIHLPSRPPLTYPFDLLVPPRLPACDAWFGFNNLACFRGLARRKIGRARKVFYWAVDFVPNRFGPGIVTRAYDRFDGLACRSADARIELSDAALRGRAEYLGLREADAAASIVAPMGAWLDRLPRVSHDAWSKRRVVYLGHLVERQGVDRLLKALSILKSRGAGITTDIVGSGPLEQSLRDQAKALQLDHCVEFHGFVDDHRDVESILATAAVAVAPYVVSEDNFTQYADPGKLKAYLAAGLPIVLTSVPPNSTDIARAGAGLIVADNPEAIADGIQNLLTDRQTWRAASQASFEYARRFDWNAILSSTLKAIGFT